MMNQNAKKTILTDEQAGLAQGAGFFNAVTEAIGGMLSDVADAILQSTETTVDFLKDLFGGSDEKKPETQVMPGFNVIEH